MCRMRQFLAVLRSFFHSSLLCTFSCHPSPPTILPSSLTSSCRLFLGLPLNLVVPKFICNTLLGILFSCHPSPPTILPSYLTSLCHLFLGLPLNLVVPKFIYNTLLGILFSSILCTCLNQRNLFNFFLFIMLVLNAAKWSASSPVHFVDGDTACSNHWLVTVCTVFLVIEPLNIYIYVKVRVRHGGIMSLFMYQQLLHNSVFCWPCIM